MWCANLNQVFRKNPLGIDFESWVILVRLDAGIRIEREIRNNTEKIATILSSQNVNYAEITTLQGKQEVYKTFNFKDGRHPLFFVFNKHPLEYSKGEKYLVIEWGRWSELDSFRNDLFAFVNFFTDEKFRQKIAKAKDKRAWRIALKFLKDHGLEILTTGATIAAL